MKLHITSTHCTEVRFATFLSSGSNKSTRKETGKTHLSAIVCLYTLPLARPAQAKIQMLSTSSQIVTILLKYLGL